MVRYENQCCGCATESYPCLGSACPNRNVAVYTCDECGEELYPSELYDYDDKHLCKDCLLEAVPKVED